MEYKNRPTEYPDLHVGAENMQTFQIKAGKGGRRKASCEEVECAMYLQGWKMKIDLGTDLGQKQAHYIKHQSGRSYKVESQRDGLVTLMFAPNQPCFNEHTTKTDLPEVFLVKGGDHRGNPQRTPTRVHKKPEFWLEEFSEHQDRIATAKEKG